MTNPHGPIGRLGALLHSLIDFTSHSATNHPPPDSHPDSRQTDHSAHHPGAADLSPIENSQSGENSRDTTMNTTRDHSTRNASLGTSAVITTLVSAVALLFSGFSFYETVLKQPEIRLYPPALVHLYRKDFRDIIAFPVTLSNDGAKRGTILSFNMEVSNPATGETRQFENLYFGNDPKDTSRIFTPLTIAGRSSVGDVVMFYATSNGAFFETTGGVPLALNIKLSMNIDKSEFWSPPKEKPSMAFTVRTNFIRSFRDMEKGTPTVLRREVAAKTDKQPAKPEDEKPQTPAQ